MELIAVFVQHSYEKVSMVTFGCLVEQFFGVCVLCLKLETKILREIACVWLLALPCEKKINTVSTMKTRLAE